MPPDGPEARRGFPLKAALSAVFLLALALKTADVLLIVFLVRR